MFYVNHSVTTLPLRQLQDMCYKALGIPHTVIYFALDKNREAALPWKTTWDELKSYGFDYEKDSLYAAGFSFDSRTFLLHVRYLEIPFIFRVKKTTRFARVFSSLQNQTPGASLEKILLFYGGKQVLHTDTPESIGAVDGDHMLAIEIL
jgi:hypothetical protein